MESRPLTPCFRNALAIVALTAISLSGSAWGASAPQADQPATLEYALQALDGFRLTEAEQALARLDSPADAEDRLYLQARIEAANYRADTGQRLAQRCLELYPRSSRCHEVAGEAFAILLAQESDTFKQMSQASRAKRSWQEAVELDPHNMRAHLMLMRYYRLAPMLIGGSKRAAKRERDTIIEMFPHREEFVRGLYAFLGEDWRDAIKHLRTAVAIDGTHAESRYYLALAYMEQGTPDPAIAELTTLVDEAPQFWEAWFNLGVNLVETGIDSRLGLKALYTFVTGAPAAGAKRLANAYYAIGRQLERDGHPDEALDAYAHALAAKPGHNESGKAFARLSGEPVNPAPAGS